MQLKLHSVQSGVTMNDLIITAVQQYMQRVKEIGNHAEDA
jgi:hypothetical protein